MSKTKMAYGKALELAQGFVQDVSAYCERIEIAGSLRRKKAEVGDIEVVCIPKIESGLDLFGRPCSEKNLLEEYIIRYPTLKGDKKYKKLSLVSIEIDLFITRPECWGVNFVIRTGSADFSQWMVTQRKSGGALPSYLHVKDARIWNGGEALDTPEEIDFFKMCGLAYIPPERRTEGRWMR